MKNLRFIRESKNLYQKDVANALGMTQQRYNNYETGKREPDQETLIRLSEYFSVSTDYLLGKTDDPTYENPLDKELDGIEFALLGEVRDMTDGEKNDVLKFVRFLKQQRGE